MLQQKKVFKPITSLSRTLPLKQSFWFSLELSKNGFPNQLAKNHGLLQHMRITKAKFTVQTKFQQLNHKHYGSRQLLPSWNTARRRGQGSLKSGPERVREQWLLCVQPSQCEDRLLAKETCKNR